MGWLKLWAMHGEYQNSAFFGTKKITSLNAFALHFFGDKEQLKVVLIDRGKRLEELAGYHYKLQVSFFHGSTVARGSLSLQLKIDIVNFLAILKNA